MTPRPARGQIIPSPRTCSQRGLRRLAWLTTPGRLLEPRFRQSRSLADQVARLQLPRVRFAAVGPPIERIPRSFHLCFCAGFE